MSRRLVIGMMWCGVIVVIPQAAVADTIYLKEKKLLKGVVVEEQADRYIVSTVDGEVPVLKSVVEAVKYDDPEQSYYQLGRQHQRAGRLREALRAYEKAVEIRPDYGAAREAAMNVQRLLWKQDESGVVDEIQRKQRVLDQAGRPPQPSDDRTSASSVSAWVMTFETQYGCDLMYEEGTAGIVSVSPGGPAALAGLQVGDHIVTIWNDPVRQLSPDELARRLHEVTGEVSMTIERTVTIQPSAHAPGNPVGVELMLDYEGVRVVSVAVDGPSRGLLAPGDRVLAINGRSPRYLTLPQVYQLFPPRKPVTCSVSRNLILRASAHPQVIQ